MSLKRKFWEGLKNNESKPGELPVLTSPLALALFKSMLIPARDGEGDLIL